jgi:hypothetical protein
MSLNCLGQLFSDWVNDNLGAVSFTIIDTNGIPHSASAYPSVTSTTSVTILIIDGSSASYTASQLQITYSHCSTPIISLPVSGQKQGISALVFELTISISAPTSLEPIVAGIVNLIGGVKPPLSFSVEGEASETTYSSSDSTCTSSVSSTGTASGSGTVSGSGSTITLSATIDYGSCQQLSGPYLSISLGSAVTGQIPGPSLTTSVCGYDSSCSITITATITIS